MRIAKISAVIILITAAIVLGVKIFALDKNPKLLNFFARFYFDQYYYLSQYPEAHKPDLDAFEHYTLHGWKEDKNPYQGFDNRFYRNIYPEFSKHYLNLLQHYVRAKLLLKKAYTHPNQLKLATTLKNPKYYLALVAIFQNEARFLKEWIEFYRLIGVEHFYLYNNLSNDNYLEVLKPYIERGIVDLKDINLRATNLKEWNKIQTDVYSKAARASANEVEWLIVVDTDEFLFPVQERNLPSLLRKYDNYASLAVNWKLFGSSNVSKIPAGKLLIESLVLANPKLDLHIKSIVKPRYVKEFNHPHIY